MRIDDYKNIILETITSEYPSYIQKKILTMLAKDELIINDKRKLKKNQEENIIDVTPFADISDKTQRAFSLVENSFKYFEQFEYDRGYRHCAFFEYTDLDVNCIKELINTGEILEFSTECDSYDFKDLIYKPTVSKIKDNYVFKFSDKLKHRENPQNTIKYTVLVVIHLKLNIIEVRLNSVSFPYRTNKDFYKDRVNKVKANIMSLLNIKISNIDFRAVVEYMKKNRNDLHITAVQMHRNGSIAYLDVSSSEELVIPILGELDALIEKKKELFQKNDDTKEIEKVLKMFIKKIEEDSDLPSVKLYWPQKNIRISIRHGYKDQNYSFFSYHEELENMERMDYVTRYLIECKRELDQQTNA